MRKSIIALAVFVLLLVALSASSARADEIRGLSTSSAILGAETWYCGALPGPGFHYIQYFLYYYADDLRGSDGKHVGGPPFSGYKAEVFAAVMRPVYISKLKFLGANLAWHAVIPVVYKHEESDFFDDDLWDLGDIYFSPLILCWHPSKTWHFAAALDIIAPTGDWDRDRIVNVGNNHWTFEPAFAASYIHPSGFTASGKFMFDIHTENVDIDYQEGAQFHMDYNLGWAFGKQQAWKVGLSGYYLISLEEDELNEQNIPDSEEQVFAVGPTIAYQYKNWWFEARTQKEFFAMNRPEGWSSWVKIIVSF